MEKLTSNGYFIAAGLLVIIFAFIIAATSVTANYILSPGKTKYVCSDFTQWKEAQEVFKDPKKKASSLDGDNDGIACEELYNSRK